MGQTVVEKVAQAHLAEGPDRPLRAGDYVSLRPRHVLTHDNTSPVMAKFRGIGATRVRDPRQPVFALDHDIQNHSSANREKYAAIETFAGEQEIDFYPAGTGIGHQVMIEQQYVVPGALVVASDSHANTYGGLGAVGTPVVRTDAAAIWATGTFWWQIPPSVQVILTGRLPAGATGKDAIMALAGLYASGEVLNTSVEFGGPGVATLSVEERLSIANMTTEWGALVGWFPPTDATFAYLRRRHRLLAERGVERITGAEIDAWEANPLRPDPDASYVARITLDLAEVRPHVAGPDTVQVATPLVDLRERRIPIQKAYLLSCVNSRVSDLAAAASVLLGRKVAPGVSLYVAAASREVQEESERRGDWQALLDAGAIPLPPGCGPCIGLGKGLLEPGEVGISATNRNFKGRMGSRDAACYLASPAVVAASAADGIISGPILTDGEPLTPSIEVRSVPPPVAETVEILEGFPERVEGRLVFLPRDNLNTDGIYGKDWTYRDDMTPARMAEVVFENYDPELAGRLRPGDLVVGGWNFGTGSSREQAVTALQAARLGPVVAASFSQTYLRNAFNNGAPCVECPALVATLRERLAATIESGARTIIPGSLLAIDFRHGSIHLGDEVYPFSPLGTVPQALVVAGGIENEVRLRLERNGSERGMTR